MNNNEETKADYERRLGKSIFYLAAADIFCAFCMIVLGGIVKNSGSSMACPDWPSCNGTYFPEMTGGVAIEYSHRLLGTLLGVLTGVIAIRAGRLRKSEPLLFKVSLLSFVLVCVQGLLGRMTVLSGISPVYSSIHLGLSHLFFGTLLYIYYKTCTPTEAKSNAFPANIPAKFVRLAAIASALVFIQICLGGIIRHFGAGPACGYGWDNAFLCHELDADAHSLWPGNWPGRLHMLHRMNGIITLFALIGLTIPLLKFARLNKLKSLRRLLIGVHIVVTAQVILGLHVIGMFSPPTLVTLHLAFGTLLWALVLSTYIKLNTRILAPGASSCCCKT